jgi:CubicO group peptidase (beta-lactamase class C family)
MSLRTARVHRRFQFYMLAHEIVSRYSGQPFYDFVASRIFAPIGMPASTYLFSAGETAGTAVHSFTRQGRRIPAWITETDEVIAGAGGVVSSTRDLSRWMTFLLGHGDENAKHSVPAAVVDETMSPQALVRGSSSLKTTVTYGFGWGQRMYRGRRVRTCARKKKSCLRPASGGLAQWRRARSLHAGLHVPGRRTRHRAAL